MAFIEPMHRNKPNITYLLTQAAEMILLWPYQANFVSLVSHKPEYLKN